MSNEKKLSPLSAAIIASVGVAAVTGCAVEGASDEGEAKAQTSAIVSNSAPTAPPQPTYREYVVDRVSKIRQLAAAAGNDASLRDLLYRDPNAAAQKFAFRFTTEEALAITSADCAADAVALFQPSSLDPQAPCDICPDPPGIFDNNCGCGGHPGPHWW